MAELRQIGNFELLQKLGQGGMGTVYKARQVSMDRVVALKILPPSFAKRKEFIERFFREARASAKLNHPNIVNGIDVGHDKQLGLYYFAMEFVDGSSVSSLLKHGAIKEFRCAEIGADIARALSHAHQNGILHRDIKPDNILIDSSGVAKLCDLGLARVESESEEEKSLTQQGQAVGTPHYISPEQAKGTRDLDVRTDLYSLGATLYHMVTGRTMFEGPTSVVIMTKHLTDKAVSPASLNPNISKHFVTILARLLTKDRNDRYTSAQQLADDLKRLQDGQAPQHADIPSGKWPFVGGEVTAPATPVKRVAAVSTVMDRSRISRSIRGTGRYSGVGTSLVPLVIAIALAVVAVAMLTGKRGGTPEANAPGAVAAKPAPSPAPKPNTPEHAPPPVAKSVPKPAPAPQAPRSTNTDIIGIVPRAAQENEPVAVVDAQKPAEPAKPDEALASLENGRPRKKRRPAESENEPGNATPAPEHPDNAAALPAPAAEARSAAGPELAPAMEKALAHAAESRYTEAAELFKALQGSAGKLDEFDRRLAKLHQQGFNGLHSLKLRVISAIKASPGKFDAAGLFRKNITGKMMSADERAIQVADPKVKAEFPLTWKGISPEDLQKLGAAVVGPLPGDAQLGLAVLAYGQNQDELARARLQSLKIPEAGELAAFIDARDEALKEKKRQELNAAAEKAFQEAEAALLSGKGEDAAKLFKSLLTSFAASEFVQSRQKELEALAQVAKAIQNDGVGLEKGNVALASAGASMDRRRHGDLIDGVTSGYTPSSGFAMIPWPGEMEVTLAKPYVLSEIRLLLWDGEDRFYRYNIETSQDGMTYTPVGDHSAGEWKSWQTLKFPARVVKHIRLKGLFNSANGGFHAVELEAYCLPPETAVTPKYPSKPPEK